MKQKMCMIKNKQKKKLKIRSNICLVVRKNNVVIKNNKNVKNCVILGIVLS